MNTLTLFMNNPVTFFLYIVHMYVCMYVCVCSSGKDIWHYDIQILPSNECIFNKYTFMSLPDAVMFYTENRLGSVFLKEPVSENVCTLYTHY